MISHAFSLHFPDKAPLALWWCFTVTVLYWCMEFSVTDLMDLGLDGLYLAHIWLHQNTPLYEITAAVSTARKRLHGNGVRGNAAQSRNHALILCYIAGQLSGDFRQRFPLCLAYVEHGDCPKTHALHPLD